MKTKIVELWCDLCPGWQDSNLLSVYTMTTPPSEKPPGTKRVKIIVELPCFGGSADVDATVMGQCEFVRLAGTPAPPI
jgi:hypothetical protein